MICHDTLSPTLLDLINVATKHDLPRRTHFQNQVQTAIFDEEQAHWVVHTKNLKTGEVQSCTGRLLFSCVGALSVPRKCDIPGADSFEGSMFHSARWDHSVDVTNKKVVVIGECFWPRKKEGNVLMMQSKSTVLAWLLQQEMAVRHHKLFQILLKRYRV